MRAPKYLCVMACLAVTACVRIEIPDSAVHMMVQPVAEAMIVAAAAQNCRSETGAWPTNVAEFSTNMTEVARIFTPTNEVPSGLKRSFTDMELRLLTNGSLFISYRPSLSSTGIVTLVVATNGGTTYPWAKNEKAESH